jgi:hypothetical protein
MSKKFVLAFTAICMMMIAVPAQASMHPNSAVDGLAHFMWHLQMTSQAAMTSNWPAFFSLFVEQSVCATTSWGTFIFTPLGLALAVSAGATTLIMFTKHVIQKESRAWQKQFQAKLSFCLH